MMSLVKLIARLAIVNGVVKSMWLGIVLRSIFVGGAIVIVHVWVVSIFLHEEEGMLCFLVLFLQENCRGKKEQS